MSDIWLDMNLWTLIAMIGSITITGSLSYYAIRQTKQQIEKGNKIESANLSLKLLEPLREDGFSEIARQIQADELTDKILNKTLENKLEIEKYFTHLEDICMFCNEDIILLNHLKNMHEVTLVKIREDNILELLYWQEMEEDPEIYEHLRKIFEKI